MLSSAFISSSVISFHIPLRVIKVGIVRDAHVPSGLDRKCALNFKMSFLMPLLIHFLCLQM
jgi:hypothetical protein